MGESVGLDFNHLVREIGLFGVLGLGLFFLSSDKSFDLEIGVSEVVWGFGERKNNI